MLGICTLMIGLLTALAMARLVKDYANPVSVYLTVWSLTVSLFLASWVSYNPVSSSLWWAVVLSAFGFCLGGGAALFWWQSKPQQQEVGDLDVDPQRLKWLIMLFTGLGGMGFLLQLMHLQQTMGISILLENPVEARRLHSNVPVWGYLNILNVANIPLCLIYRKVKARYEWWMFATLIFAISAALITTDRTRFFYMAIWSFFVWFYLARETKALAKKMGGVALLGSVLLLFFVSIGEHYERKYRDRFPENIHLSEEFSLLVEPYIYLTGSLAALDALILDENPMYLGKFTFSPLVSLAKVAVPDLETVPLQGKLYFVPMEVNTYSYLQQFYQDFGWWGILLGPYLCGWLSAGVYIGMRQRQTLFTVYLAGLLSFCCVISVFVNTFTQEATWFFVAVGLATKWWSKPRR